MPTTLEATGLELLLEENTLGSGSVSSWTDQSTKGRTLTATAPQPVVTSPAINGKKAVTWNGSANPLVYNGVFPVRCGFMVCKTAAFTNYNGLLSSPLNYAILEGKATGTEFFNNLYDYFEYRKNDLGFHADRMLAPVDEWSILFFHFHETTILEGIQIGQDRNQTNRKLNGSVALLALYSSDLSEEQIAANTGSIAFSYQIPIADVFPYCGDRAESKTYGKIVLTDGQPEPLTSVKRGIRKKIDGSFSDRMGLEFRRARDFWDKHYPSKTFVYRDRTTKPFEDTIVAILEGTEFEDKGGRNALKNYGMTLVERLVLNSYSIPGNAPVVQTPLDTRIPTTPVITVSSLAATTPAIRGVWTASTAYGGRTIQKYFVRVDGGAVYDAGTALQYDVGSLPFDNDPHTMEVRAFDGTYFSAWSAPDDAVAGAGTSVPIAPEVFADDNLNTLYAQHDLGNSEIEYVGPSGSGWIQYTGTINVGNVALPSAAYKFRTKATSGRPVSPVAISPAFTVAQTGTNIYDGGNATTTATDVYDGGTATTNYPDIYDGGGA